jgi:hypothetical protein
MTDKPSTAADGRGLLGPDFLGGMDPADWVREQRDDAPPIPEGVQQRVDWVNSLLPEGMRLDTTPVLPPSQDFVPEPYPRPGWSSLADNALFVRQQAARVQECPLCGGLWDGDGPDLCPDCEDYMAELPGAVWDEA